MTTKLGIIDALGEKQLLRPGQGHSGRAANKRAKYYFALLQLAKEQCEHPAPTPPDLAAEREASGVSETEFDGVIAGSRGLPGGRCRILSGALVLARIGACLDEMLAPVELAVELGLQGGADDDRRRRAAVAKLLCGTRRDQMALISALTHRDPNRGDSPHLLVIDLYKELNRLQREVSRESVDGAAVYGLHAPDKELVRAFKRGLNATHALKLDNRGLGCHDDLPARGHGRTRLGSGHPGAVAGDGIGVGQDSGLHREVTRQFGRTAQAPTKAATEARDALLPRDPFASVLHHRAGQCRYVRLRCLRGASLNSRTFPGGRRTGSASPTAACPGSPTPHAS